MDFMKLRIVVVVYSPFPPKCLLLDKISVIFINTVKMSLFSRFITFTLIEFKYLFSSTRLVIQDLMNLCGFIGKGLF